ncbi:MarR family winged helix-turn-helix transcriptional regulator [Rhodovibrionaceae bacterium A322]
MTDETHPTQGPQGDTQDPQGPNAPAEGTSTASDDQPGEPARLDPRYRIITWVGIINQLATHKAGSLLSPQDLPLPQFQLLNHFSHRPDEGKTVTRVARAMQQPQPGITKTLQKLVARGYLSWRPNPEDGRSKLLFMTPEGQAVHQQAVSTLLPALAEVFQDWDDREISDLFAQLDRIKIYLDDNR